MNGVLGATQLLETTRLDAEQRAFVDLLRSSANAQMSLISDLIDISRIDAGRRRLDAPLRAARHPRRGGRHDAGRRRKKASSSRPSGTRAGTCLLRRRRAFRQVVTNLVGNAVKFTDAGQRQACTGRARRREAGRMSSASRHRHRARHPRGGAAAHLRAVLPGGRLDVAARPRAPGSASRSARSWRGRWAARSSSRASSASGSTFTLTASFRRSTDAPEARPCERDLRAQGSEPGGRRAERGGDPRRRG